MNRNLKAALSLGLVALVAGNAFSQNKYDGQGRMQGPWIKKDSKDRIIYKGQFKDNYPVDTFYYYDKKGNVEMKNFFSDKGKQTHTMLLYSDGSLRAEGNYTEKQKQGLWVYYNRKGAKITEENYKDNLKDGVQKNWDSEGKNLIKSTTYKQGKKDGEYFQSLYGEGYYTAQYKNDKLDGAYNEYFPNKVNKVKGQYAGGRKQGTWQVFDINGTLLQKLYYKDDELTGDAICFNVQSGVKEIAQKDIALIRQAGKQTQIILLNGDRINCFNSVGGVIPLTSQELFVRVNEKSDVYMNLNVIKGLNSDGSIKTDVDFGFKIMPDKDGLQMIKSMFE